MLTAGVDALPVLRVDEEAVAVIQTRTAQRVVAGVPGQPQSSQGEIRSGPARRNGVRRIVHCRRHLRSVGHHLVGEQGLQIVRGLPQQLGAAREHIGAAHRLPVARVGHTLDSVARPIAHPAILPLLARHHAQRELVRDQRHIERALGVELIETAGAALGFDRRLVDHGCLGLDHHCAARSVLAEEGALWAAQYFEILDISTLCTTKSSTITATGDSS
jgi:hypothetical protein